MGGKGRGLTEGPEGAFDEKGLLTVVIVWMSRCVIYSNANVLEMHLCEPWVTRHSPGNTRI